MKNDDSDSINDIEQARKRIKQLEEKLSDAIDIILKRDDELRMRERRITELEEILERNQKK